LYGDTEDAVRIVNMSSDSEDSMIAVEAFSDVDTHIDAVSFEGNTMKTLFTLFQTQEDAIWFGSWDARKTMDGNGNVSYVCAAVLSSGIRHEPPNVWACRVSGEQREISNKIKLSSHLQWLADAPVFKTEVMRWKAADGTELSGLVRYPPGYDVSHGRLPTVLFIHGGPYR
jgi:dipeptidyl aminopeptidase/acylaminoacyl peptidase